MAILAALCTIAVAAGRCSAADADSLLQNRQANELIKLAAAKFPNLTRCERAVLLNATTHGNIAWQCGPSAKPDDPSNDPAKSAQWDHQRDLRAELIRWLFVDPEAVKRVDPTGVSALGARIVGALDLLTVHAPFGLWLVRCAMPEGADLSYADIGPLFLSGSHTGAIEAGGSHIRGFVALDSGFEASGRVFFGNSRIDSDFIAAGGSFRHNSDQDEAIWSGEKPALFLGVAHVQGPIWLSQGFKADGAVDVNSVTCVSILCSGGRFINPGNLALQARDANLSGLVYMSNFGKWAAMEAAGQVVFDNARIAGPVSASGMKFLGKSTEAHGFSANAMSAGGAFVWQNVQLQNGATLDLRSASVNGLSDDERSWPLPGRLAIDGFSYRDFYSGPADARSRLRWLALASGPHPAWLVVPGGFHSQPYLELAKVLRQRGDGAGATMVAIRAEDLRYSQYGIAGRAWGTFLKWTIGYGHRPFLAIVWSIAVVLLGWLMIVTASRAGIMRETWPENAPDDRDHSYEPLHPLLYSLDAFLPFVNLHQEHYWWPDANVVGRANILGLNVSCSGKFLRYYLWLQIIAGWILSAIFVAGVTGLIRSD